MSLLSDFVAKVRERFTELTAKPTHATPPPFSPTERYQYQTFKFGDTPVSYNKLWMVVVGVGPLVHPAADTDIIIIQDPASSAIYDRWTFLQSTAAGFGEHTLRRRMLVPPGFQLVLSGGGATGGCIVILAQTLDEAVAVL